MGYDLLASVTAKKWQKAEPQGMPFVCCLSWSLAFLMVCSFCFVFWVFLNSVYHADLLFGAVFICCYMLGLYVAGLPIVRLGFKLQPRKKVDARLLFLLRR